ncbi:MAG: hypothetical protein GY703_17130 [Gammaproteobacteria bacterium]|nr:hypothetical protein [Gammaproteobacteria bacterium]
MTALQTYADTARPFDFNGIARHYYVRQQSRYGEIQVQLLNKKERSRSSHEIAEQGRT